MKSLLILDRNLISFFNDLSEKPPPQELTDTTVPPAPISYLVSGPKPEADKAP